VTSHLVSKKSVLCRPGRVDFAKGIGRRILIANRIVCFCNIREVSTGRVVRTCHIVREDGETFAFFGKPSAIAATVPCNAMQCHAMPCNAVQCHAMPCNAMQCHAMPCNPVQCRAMPCKQTRNTRYVRRNNARKDLRRC